MTDNAHTTTDLEQTLTVTETQQVIEEEQRTTTHENSHVDPARNNIYTMDDYTMKVDDVSSRNILETPVIIQTVTWQAEVAALTTLATFNIPDVFLTVKNFHDTMLTTYSAVKPTLVFHFKLNSTPFHQGKLLCWYNPLNQLSVAPSNKTISLTSISMQPSVFLDASLANSGEIEVPFEFFKTYFNTNSDSGLPPMGSINITVFNPLLSAPTATTNATVQVLLSCKDLQLQIPIHPHTVLFSSGSIAESPVVESYTQALGELWTATKGVIGSAKDTYGNFMTGNFSGAADSLSSGVKSVGDGLKVFNLDKPAIIEATTRNCIYPSAPLAHMRGTDSSVRLGAAPVGGYLTHDLFSSTSASEHSIQTLAAMKGYYETVQWTTDQVPGTVLSVLPVAPWLQATGQTVTVGGSTYQGMENTYLSYLAAFFNFWRGSISFRWDFVSSKMHSGRVAFIFFPNDDPACKYGASPPSLDLSLYTNNPIYYFDLAESKTAEVTVPYAAGTHMKWMLAPQERASPGALPSQLENYLTGTIAVVVINQLMAPSSVTPNITFNTFVGAGPDMEFESPYAGSNGYFYADLGNPPPIIESITQALEPQPTRSKDVVPINYLLKGGGAVQKLDAYNEHITDVRDLARRYTLYDTINIPAVLNTTTQFYEARVQLYNSPTIFTEVPASPTRLTYDSFLNRVSMIYAFWHGSLRYKIFPYCSRDSSVQLIARYNFSARSFTDPLTLVQFLQKSADPTSWTNLSQQSALEVELPYYSIYTQLQTVLSSGTPTAPQTYSTGLLDIGARGSDEADFLLIDSSRFFPVHIMHAGGDDLAFSFPVAPPQTYYLI